MDVRPDGSTVVTRARALQAAGAGLLVLVLLGAAVLTSFGPVLRLDAAASTAVYVGDDRAPWLGALLEVLTAPGSALFRISIFVPAMVWLLWQRLWWTALWVFAANALVGLITTLLKEFTGRARPAFEEGGAQLDTLSYPSGHASGIATMVTVALILVWPRLAGPAARRAALAAGVAIVVVVGLTRMWLGVHYLSDVIGGWSLGVAWALLTAVYFGAMSGGRAALPQRT